MVRNLLKLIPGVGQFVTIAETAADLFSAGQDIYEGITGEKPKGKTPKEFTAELETLTPDQQKIFVEKINAEIKMYNAVTERMKAEQGTLDPALMEQLPEEKAGDIAWLRMATRPRVILMLAWAVIVPIYGFLIQFLINIIIATLNTLSMAHKWTVKVYETGAVVTEEGQFIPYTLEPLIYQPIAVTFNGGTMYESFVAWAVSAIISYLTLRQVGKAIGNTDNPNKPDQFSKFGNAAMSLFNTVKTIGK